MSRGWWHRGRVCSRRAKVTLAVGAALLASGAAPALASASVGNWSELQQGFSEGGTVQLGRNIEASGGDSLAVGGSTVMLDLNGYTLTIASPPENTAGISVPSSASLTIEDTSAAKTGTLDVTGGEDSAAIGESLEGGACGSVVIEGGTVEATGAEYGAGIGGGASGGGSFTTGGAGCALTIEGGSVTAKGGEDGAGIGGGYGVEAGGAGGTVTIEGGSVTAKGGFEGAGIGGGKGGTDEGGSSEVGGVGATVTIEGGTVAATGGYEAVGIGGGFGDEKGGAGGTVAIEGGSVTATGGTRGTGIGGGDGVEEVGGAGAAVTIGSAAQVSVASGSEAIGGGLSNATSGAFGSLSNAGSLTIASGSTLLVPSKVTVPSTGTLDVKGELAGDGKVENTGVILASGTVAGHGKGNGTSGLLVEPNNYELSFAVNGGSGSAPASRYVYAGTLSAAEQALPAGPTPPSGASFTGWFTAASGGSQVLESSGLDALFGAGPVSETLYAQYAEAASVTTQPQDTTVSAGEDATFTAAASGYPAPAVQWQSSSDGGSTWQEISGATSSTLSLDDVSVSQSGTEYRAVYTNASREVDSNAATLTVEPIAQSIAFTPLSSPVSAGTSAPLAASGGGSGEPVELSVDAAGTSPADACTVSQSGPGEGTVSYAHVGTCELEANEAGSANGNYAAALPVHQTLAIEAVASTVTLSNPATTVFGQAATVTATVSEANGASPAGTVQFTLDGADLGGPVAVTGARASSPDFTTGAAQALAPGSYQLGATFTPQDESVYGAGSATAVTQIVDQAATSAALVVRGGSITATVAAVAPGAGTPTGTVTFSVDGSAVGAATLSGGTATLAYEVPAGATRTVAAAYAGDADFTASSASSSRSDPTISARVSSAHARSRDGWYRTPVKVTFTCATDGAALTAACPQPVTLEANGAGQSVSRTITATNGGAATVVVGGIDIDRTKPTVGVAGVSAGHVYDGSAPQAHCVAIEKISGVASCRIETHRSRSTHGLDVTTVRYTAIATDRAGESRRVSGSYEVLGIYLQGVAYRHGSFQVRLGRAYTILVTGTRARPRYWDAAPDPLAPSGLDNPFHRAGPRTWAEGITITNAMSHYSNWNLGVKIGSALHVLPIHERS